MLKRILAVLSALGVVAFAVYEGLFWYQHVHVANAFVDARFTILSSATSGTVLTLDARPGERVKQGQRLATMDAAQAELQVRSLRADLQSQLAARKKVEAELDFFLADLEGKLADAGKAARLARRTYVTAIKRVAAAQKVLDREQAQSSRRRNAQEVTDSATDRLLQLQAEVTQLDASAKLHEQELVALERRRQQREVFESRLAMLDGELERARAELGMAEQRLASMQLLSPIDGVLNKVHVSPGSFVASGEPLLLLHDPSELWIDAHVSETDIRLVRNGQRVLIELDAYPREQFEGKVDAIGDVTVGRLLNVTEEPGNAVQRIPVRIAMPAIAKPVWPGMRAAVNIVVRQL